MSANVGAPRKRRWWIAAVIAVAVLVGLWFAVDTISRMVVSNVIKEKVASALHLPADHEIAVNVGGVMVPQLLAQSLEQVHVSTKSVTVGKLTGDLSADAHGLAFDGSAKTLTAELSMDANAIRAILPDTHIDIDTVELAAPDIRIGTKASVWGSEVPLSLRTTPSASDGNLLLTPAGFQVGGVDVDASQLRTQLGGVAGKLLDPWPVCVADRMPAGITLKGVTVRGDRVVADADVAGTIATDPALRQFGTCSQ